MYLILRSLDDPATHWKGFFVEDIAVMETYANSLDYRVYRLDGLNQVMDVEVSYREILEGEDE